MCISACISSITSINKKNKRQYQLHLQRHVQRIRKIYQPRTNIVKDEKGNFFTDSHSIMSRWRDHFSQLLNVHGVNDVRQMEIQ